MTGRKWHLFKMGHPRPLFRLYLSWQTNITIFTTNFCEKCPSILQCWDSNPQPSELESPPITTRPGHLKAYILSISFANGQPCLQFCHQRVVHKRKISAILLNTNKYFVFNCNVLALFTFYAVPSSDKYKCMLVHFTVFKD